MRRKRVYLSLLTLLLILGLARLGDALRGREKGVDESWRIWEETRASIPFEHRWTDTPRDIGHRRSVRSSRGRLRSQPLMQISTQIERQRLVERVIGFGVPEEWMSSDRGLSPFAMEAEGAKRGVKVRWTSYREYAVEPDYGWIVQESITDLRDTAKQLQGIAAQLTPPSARDLLRIVASFVQTIPYKIPSTWRELPDGDRLCRFGIAVPIEVLFLKWGDCDSKSLLFASILANFPGESVVFVRGDHHLFAGVRSAPRRGDHYVRIQGIPYVLVELTGPWPVGHVPPELYARTKKGLFEIIPVLRPAAR
jgi:hypothetical protein